VPAQDSPLSRNEAILTPALPQASDILAALGQAVFAWDIASDVIVWGEQLSAVFPGIPAERLATGAEFAKLIEPAPSLRTAALAQTSAVHGADGTPYRVEYGVRMSAADPWSGSKRPAAGSPAPTAARSARSAPSASTMSATPATRN